MTADRCPIDGARVESERVDDFHVCSRCRELLDDFEVVERKTRKARKAYLAVNYPKGYDK